VSAYLILINIIVIIIKLKIQNHFFLTYEPMLISQVAINA